MAISVFLDPSQMPARTQEQQVFDNFMAQLVQNLPTLAAQINATEAGMNAAAAGGAYALPYVFDAAVADVDPGAGKLRLSSATQNTSTVMRLDLTVAGQDYTSVIDSFDLSTNAVKGSIRLVKFGDLTKWMTFDVTARAAPSGYRNLTVTCTGSSGASPFANGDGVLLFFQRTGDKGDTGNLPLAQYVKVTHRTSATTAGSATGNSTVIRELNTVEVNTLPGASLSSNTVTLPAGTYRFRGRAPAFGVGNHACLLYNATDGTVIRSGSSAYSTVSSTTQVDSFVSGFFTLSAAKGIQLRHYMTNAQTNGLGYGVSADGNGCLYAELEFEKIV